MQRRNALSIAVLSWFSVLVLEAGAPAQAQDRGAPTHAVGAVFTLSNEASGNRVLSFVREADGSLHEGGSYPTGGTGTDAALHSQNALVLTEDQRFLIAVNAGSNELSSFAVHGAALTLRSKVSSQGVLPVSVTSAGGLVYVSNAGAPSNVAGFWLDPLGVLHALPGAVRPLSAPDAGPAQVQVSPSGRELIVTERLSNNISSFEISRFGQLGNPVVSPSKGKVPFGFDFTRRGILLVSEAASTSLSSYDVDRRGTLDVISGALSDEGAAPCWVITSADQRYAYVANAGSQSISAYAVDHAGALTLAAAVAGDSGPNSVPQDLGLEPHGRSLYLLDRGNAGIARFDASDPVKLVYLDLVGELPPFASGIAVH